MKNQYHFWKRAMTLSRFWKEKKKDTYDMKSKFLIDLFHKNFSREKTFMILDKWKCQSGRKNDFNSEKSVKSIFNWTRP